jgi:hypothetical protein
VARAQRELGEEAASASAAALPRVQLQIVRLTREETAVAPIALLAPEGGLAGATAAALAAAPARPSQGGPFNAFSTEGGPPGQLWVVRRAPDAALLTELGVMRRDKARARPARAGASLRLRGALCSLLSAPPTAPVAPAQHTVCAAQHEPHERRLQWPKRAPRAARRRCRRGT